MKVLFSMLFTVIGMLAAIVIFCFGGVFGVALSYKPDTVKPKPKYQSYYTGKHDE